MYKLPGGIVVYRHRLDKLVAGNSGDDRVPPAGTGERVFNYIGNPGVVELDPSLLHALYEFMGRS